MDDDAKGFLQGLNESQKAAVNHHNGPLLVVAGAGSGKTRALTHRIAHLIGVHGADPSEILAVTFTNKAAREMKERLEILLARRLAENHFGEAWNCLNHLDKSNFRKKIYQNITKELWIGTFHSIFAKLLRYDIERFNDPKGLSWSKNFSIYDESDAQTLVKEIVTQELQVDPKKFEPKKIRRAISNAKNKGYLPEDVEKEAEGLRGKLIAESYKLYRSSLAANNALDFDDLLLMPVQLLQQNTEVRSYWHHRFKHVLVDEYQDTNHTQYELIKLIVANGSDPSMFNQWDNRSIFVVGDADQSIYSFRAADFRILMGFQKDFKSVQTQDNESLIIKLEDNYRSTSNILEAANTLISNNKERIEKTLRATRQEGDKIRLTRCDDEIAEAEAIVHKIRILNTSNHKIKWGDIAILYRTNAQSRVIEESLVRWGIPYIVVGGLRFYDRREIKDILAYLKLLNNLSDTVSLLRIINIPRRGIGKTTIERLGDAANQLGIPLWELVSDDEAVQSIGGRSAKGVINFSNLIKYLKDKIDTSSISELIQLIMEKSEYLSDLISNGSDEAEERRRNLQELVNAAVQFQEENEAADLEGFLASAALASDGDTKDTASDRVTLMTLHSSKGLEFPVVFLSGMEQGLFPSYRSLDDPASLEEERRLCYVGLTRAKEKLFLSNASERRLWGGMREAAVPSLFLSEIPEYLMEGEIPRTGGAALRRDNHLNRLTRIDRYSQNEEMKYKVTEEASNAIRSRNPGTKAFKAWKVGDKIIHTKFGKGEITHVFGEKEKISIAVKFSEIPGPKIIDPRLAPIKVLEI